MNSTKMVDITLDDGKREHSVRLVPLLTRVERTTVPTKRKKLESILCWLGLHYWEYLRPTRSQLERICQLRDPDGALGETNVRPSRITDRACCICLRAESRIEPFIDALKRAREGGPSEPKAEPTFYEKWPEDCNKDGAK